MRTLQVFVLTVISFASLSGIATADEPRTAKYWVFIGTGGGKLAKGIYRCEFDAATGKLTAPELAAESANPNFLALHPTGKFLYAVGGVTMNGKQVDGVLSFSVDAVNGKLTKLNEQPSAGSGPCHLIVDPQGKNLLTAQYGSGTTNVFPLESDGKIGPLSTNIQHKGKGADPSRQSGPHAHSVNISKDNRFAYVADLGLDKVLIFKLESATGKLVENDPAHLATAPGAGPRHFAFHPNGKLAFVINELDSTLSSLSFNSDNGELKTLKTVSTLPKGFKGKNTTAEVVVHPNGKFVYGSNRGHDSIAAFSLDEKTGDLTFVSYATEGIKEPRNFNIDPTGQYVIVGSQRSNQVLVFKVNQETGALSPTGQSFQVGTPICFKFLAVAK